MKFSKRQLRQISPYLVIGAFYILAFFAIGIDGDFPLNDDWAYAEGVRHLLLGEGLVMPTVCAAGIAHVCLGVLTTKLLGYSCISLRIYSFFITVVGAIALFFSASTLRIPRAQALFLTLLYAANPILINIGFSFMSDSTGLALNLIFLACLYRGLEKKSLEMMLLAFLVLSLSVTVRQSALIFLVLVLFCLSDRFEETRKKILVFVIALVCPLIAGWACDQWLITRQLGESFSNTDYDLVRKAHSDAVCQFVLSAPTTILPTINAVGHVFCYLVLFLLPCSPALIALAVRRKGELVVPLKVILGIVLLVILSAFTTINFYHQTMPFSENILRITTVGAQGILGIIRQPLQARERMILTIFSFAMIVPLAVALVSLLRVLMRRALEWRVVVLLVSVIVCIVFLSLETIVRCTDRYYLIALGPVLLAIGFIAKRAKQNLVSPISISLLVALAFYSVGANQEYLSSNRARWKAIEWLEARGVEAASFDGGYEYNVLRDITVYNSKSRGEAPRDSWRWWPVRGESYLISYSPVPGYREIHLEKYYSLLDRKVRNVQVLERIDTVH